MERTFAVDATILVRGMPLAEVEDCLEKALADIAERYGIDVGLMIKRVWGHGEKDGERR